MFCLDWYALNCIEYSRGWSGRNPSFSSAAKKKVSSILVRVNHAVIQIQSSILIWFVSIMWCIDRITRQGICQDVIPRHTHTHSAICRSMEASLSIAHFPATLVHLYLHSWIIFRLKVALCQRLQCTKLAQLVPPCPSTSSFNFSCYFDKFCCPSKSWKEYNKTLLECFPLSGLLLFLTQCKQCWLSLVTRGRDHQRPCDMIYHDTCFSIQYYCNIRNMAIHYYISWFVSFWWTANNVSKWKLC